MNSIWTATGSVIFILLDLYENNYIQLLNWEITFSNCTIAFIKHNSNLPSDFNLFLNTVFKTGYPEIKIISLILFVNTDIINFVM